MSRPKGRSKAKPGNRPRLPAIVHNEASRTPQGEGRVDRFHDPKTGRYLSREEAERRGYVRQVRGEGGPEILHRKSDRSVRKVLRPEVGKAFTDQIRPNAAVDVLNDAAGDGRKVYVKIGGKVFRVPPGKEADLRSLFLDLRSKFFQASKKVFKKP